MKKLFLLLLFIASPLQAENSFLDFIQAKINEYTHHASHQPEDIYYGRSLTDVEKEPYDASYDLLRVIEPHFNSPLFVLQAGKQHAETVLLVHGVGDNASKDWLTVIPELAQHYHVVAIDLPGFALSAGTTFRYSPENYSKVLNWVQQTFAKGKMSLVGHSMGGGVSLYYAATYPETLKKLILVDAAGIIDRTAFVKHLSTLPDIDSLPSGMRRFVADFRNFGLKWVEKTGLFFDPTELLDKNEYLRNWLLDGNTNINAALSLVGQNFAELDFSKVPPTHMIWGAKDRVAPARTGKALLQVLPNRQLHLIPEAGHVPMTSHPYQFNQLLLTALHSQPSPQFQLSARQSSRVGICKGDDHPKFAGAYQRIELHNCRMAELDGVQAEEFVAQNSLAQISNSKLGKVSQTIAITNSALIVTNSYIYGTIDSSQSNLDLAGVTLQSNKAVLKTTTDNVIVLSLVTIDSKYYSGLINATLEVDQGTLEEAIHAKLSPDGRRAQHGMMNAPFRG